MISGLELNSDAVDFRFRDRNSFPTASETDSWTGIRFRRRRNSIPAQESAAGGVEIQFQSKNPILEASFFEIRSKNPILEASNLNSSPGNDF